ncbi:hypothetical protein RM543_06395 [Roseicyclus sp. F158]|uniref:RepB-like DNA primase domain-containing protein n=1 Tax=Tropicimonas omnivorans TaxID=3075590 RepID=A0ABU3DF19_9RHOB|nr:hypothetical protein [Roseicyclus sp. F158]MDT0682306.1 hypothetical protein [Roseicyclus sp. F158]
MEHFAPSSLDIHTPVGTTLSPADYVRLLHTPGSVGKTSVMVKACRDRIFTKTYSVEDAPQWIEPLLDYDAYITLHRFHGPRSGHRLAALNGLFLDLDIDRVPSRLADSGRWASAISARASELGLPEPSILLFTGRGLGAIWLIDEMPARALPRWQAAQDALIALFRAYGADPSCRDAARVTRLPGSINSKSGKEAAVIGGSLRRYCFDALADAIYLAAGRPTREQLRSSKEATKKKKKKAGIKQTPGGLTPRAKFRAVQRDLERICYAWGGRVPEGFRNTWLHLFATSLSHTSTPAEVEQRVMAAAALATPFLPAAEVRAVVKLASRQAELPRSTAPYATAAITTPEL